MKKTNQQIFDFVSEANAYLSTNKEATTKMTYAIERMIGNAQTRKKGFLSDLIADYYDKVDDLRTDHCSVDEKGNILKDANKELMFTKANDKALKSAIKALNNTEVEIKSYIATEIDFDSLTEGQLEVFQGFVIPVGAPVQVDQN